MVVKRYSLVLLAALAALALARPCQAEPPSTEYVPKAMEGVGITEHLNANLPLNLEFVDENGGKVHLGDYFKPNRPVLLTFNYYSCPMLCTEMLNGMAECMANTPLVVGRDYEIVTLSFNPREGAQLAKAKRANYFEFWSQAGIQPIYEDGWHFLTGGQAAIEELTKAAGFTYRWDEETQQYVHNAALIFATPDGRISRYLYGVKFEPDTVKLTLVEAAAGKIGTPVDQILLYCFQYDSVAGSYVPVAVRIMRLVGVLSILIVGIFVLTLWNFERAKRKRSGVESMNLQEKHV